MIVLSGVGTMFSSGNDLNNFSSTMSSGKCDSLEEVAEQGRVMLSEFVRSFLLCTKILVAAVNGDGVGIMFTVLPLFDLVFSVPNAKFYAPFSRLGQTPEGCSTFTFPRIFGTSRATEILMLGNNLLNKTLSKIPKLVVLNLAISSLFYIQTFINKLFLG